MKGEMRIKQGGRVETRKERAYEEIKEEVVQLAEDDEVHEKKGE